MFNTEQTLTRINYSNILHNATSGLGEPWRTNSSKAAIFQDGVLQPEVVFAGRFSLRRRHFSIESDCLPTVDLRHFSRCWTQTSTYFTLPLLFEHQICLGSYMGGLNSISLPGPPPRRPSRYALQGMSSSS